jgi:aminopeptidase N
MRSGLKQMVTLLRGQETSYDALRSALEQSGGKNLAELFRVWLNDRDIPADFRARYGGQTAEAQH